jgi:predicted aspartyl protease
MWIMIQGDVNEDFEAIVPLRLHGPKGDFEDVTAIVDTGFTGTLVINDAVVKSLQLNQKRRFGTAKLADGSEIHFQQY